MSVNFKADKSFTDYISMRGYKRRQVDSEKEYYSNDLGNQIKIDNESGLISLLDKHGNTVDFASSFSSEQIDKFSNTGGL